MISSLNRLHAKVPAAGGFFRLLRLAASAGLVTRIRSGASRLACARDKTAYFFGAALHFFLALLLIQSSILWAATPPNTDITNTASVSYSVVGTPLTVSGSATVTTAGATPATIAFLQYVPSSVGLPTGFASLQNVPVSQCNAGAGFLPLPAPVVPGRPALTVPGSVLLAPASLYASGDPVFVRVTDYDQNLDPLVAETVVVSVSSNGIDIESLRLTETGPSTGVFTGYIQSTSAVSTSGNCVLSAGGNQPLRATYMDQSQGGVAVTAAALVDPLGVVFSSATGLPVNGATITLIDNATNLPAAVFGNDGVSTFPATVISGGTVTDSGGTVYAFGPGRYQFPRIAPGSYRLLIVPPPLFTAPSLVTTAILQALPGAPFFIVAGSRGENFPVLPGPPVEIDISLDPDLVGGVQITKTADKAVVAIGEFVPYSITIRNSGTTATAPLRIGDRLPVGFRYERGSARLNKALVNDPTVSADGRSLEFDIGTLAGNSTSILRYVAGVLAGAKVGQAENTAQAVAGATSNVARASVLVREDLNRSRAILVGRVTQVESCEAADDDAGSKALGLKNVRVLMQDGTYIVTDLEGRWHADNIRPGTHVVQLDETSLPKGVVLEVCEQNTRSSGRNFSQFVNLRGGTLWRADFRLKPVPSCLSEQIRVQGSKVSIGLAAPVATDATNATVMLPNGAKIVAGSVQLNGQPFAAEPSDGFLVAKLGAQAAAWTQHLSFDLESPLAGDLAVVVQMQPKGQSLQRMPALRLKAPALETSQCAPIALPVSTVKPAPGAGAAPGAAAAVDAPVAAPRPHTLQLVEVLPYDDKWIAAAAPGVEWLHPQTGFNPALPVIKVAVKHAAKEQVELNVNGAPVNPMRYEGVLMNPAGTLAVSRWHAVDLRDGANLMEVIVRDAQGQVVLQESRSIHYAVGPASAAFDVARSQLSADGRIPPVIAVRMLDKEGKPVRRGLVGDFQINVPYLSKDQADAIQSEPLTGNLDGKARYQIGEDGVALIALQPTTQAGEVVLKFDFGNNRVQEVRAWLKPDLREWVMVGFAEGTLGHKKLSGNVESLDATGADGDLFDQNRIAFYAKGQVKGEYLLTVAYDSAKEKGSAGSKLLQQGVDPNQYYTLYADATQPQFDAASARKLYLKIEKSQFYAMFGDFDTGLSVTELGRYSRTLNGAKTEYKGKRFGYNAFASQTAQGFRKDEIQGDGTSGLYRLQSGNIVINSDKVRIEVRDQFRPEIIISTRTMTRYLDYQIDHALGTLFFREPVTARDAAFNPRFIVVEYESGSQLDVKLTYGGRVSMKIGSDATAPSGQTSEVGLTRIHEGNVGREATLTAADATLRIGDNTKLRVEAATSDRIALKGAESGQAFVAEVAHVGTDLTARAYVRRQDAGFGLGQQAGSEVGTRKIGADARYKLSDSTQLQGEVYREQNQTTGAQRDVVEAKSNWYNDGLSLSGGARIATEADGQGREATVRQILGGVGYELLDKRLTLRANAELDGGGSDNGVAPTGSTSTAFPNRLILGADYKLTSTVTVFGQHELARGDEFKADTTRVGLRMQPWTGGEVLGSLGSQSSLDGNRLYGNMGLVQKWKITDEWAVDFGVDRSQTFSSSSPTGFQAAQAPASGTAGGSGTSVVSTTPGVTSTSLVAGDYTALFAGGAYRHNDWSGNGRIEWRTSDTDQRVNFLIGAQRNLENGRAAAAGLIYTSASGTLNSSKLDARLSYASRPLNAQWIWLDRLQYVHDSTHDLAGRVLTRKLINNLNANWMPTRQTQIALQYGIKYVRDSIDSQAYTGVTDLMGVEAQQDIGEHFDIGLHASRLHSWKRSASDLHLGLSVGFKATTNSWLSVGYNQRGFVDPDFTGAAYRARGLYLNLRVKFDQDTFNLNDRDTGQLPLKR